MKKITIGRNSTNDIIINNPNVSSSHAIIIIGESGEFILRDLNSTNGTYVNGKKIKEIKISSLDNIQICDSAIKWQDILNKQPNPPTELIHNPNSITIGRNSSNNIVLNQSDVSSFHATISKSPSGEIYIQDNNSSNGTYVNGRKISRHQLIAGDRVLLANKYIVEWGNLYKKGTKNIVRNPKTKVWMALIGTVVIIVVGLSFFSPIVKFVNDKIFTSAIDVNEKYKNAIVLVYQSFVYKVDVGDKVFYLTKENDKFRPYEEGNTKPIEITGTGFFVSKTGEIITNRHVAVPWEYSEDKEELEQNIKEYLKQDAQFASPSEQFEIFELLKNLKISGKSINIGIAINNSFITSLSDFTPCVLSKESGKKDIDVAMLQTKTKSLPASITNIVNLDEALIDENQLKIGEQLNMIGFPAGFQLATTKKGIMANFQSGQITRLADGVDFGHNVPTIGGGSGSPIFNNEGNLVGINYQGLIQTQGFNMAMLAKYAIELKNK
jgi:pSer/pThr/pTyr-binding forkhead associated (FHA) protein